MSTANVTQTGQAATVSVTVSRGLPGATGATGAPGTTDYNELENVPTEFPPSAHDHVVSDITPVSGRHLIGRHANGTGDAQEVTVSGGLEFSGSGIQIANTAVTAAEYTAPTITVDAKGRITGAASVTYETPAGAEAKIAAYNPQLAIDNYTSTPYTMAKISAYVAGVGAAGAPPVRIMRIGDSLSAQGLLCGGPLMGFAGSIGNFGPVAGGTGSYTYHTVPSKYEWSINGHAFEFNIGATWDITNGASATGDQRGNKCVVGFVKRPLGASFVLQYQTNATGAWTTLDTIDTESGDGSTYGVYGEYSLPTLPVKYRLRITTVTGDVGDTAVISFWGIYHSNGGGVIEISGMDRGGAHPSDYNTPTPVFNPFWEGLAPDLVISMWNDAEAAWLDSGAWDILYDKMVTVKSNTDHIVCSAYPNSSSEQEAIYALARVAQSEWAKRNKHSYYDVWNLFRGDWTSANALGLMTDGTHPSNLGREVAMRGMWSSCSLGRQPLGSTGRILLANQPYVQQVGYTNPSSNHITQTVPLDIRHTGGLRMAPTDLTAFSGLWEIKPLTTGQIELIVGNNVRAAWFRGAGFWRGVSPYDSTGTDPNKQGYNSSGSPHYRWKGVYTNTFSTRIATKTASYTCDTATADGTAITVGNRNYDHTILCDSTAGAMTITLPPIVNNQINEAGVNENASIGRMLIIKKIDASANAVTVDANASETIDGALTYDLTDQNQSVTLQCDGTKWVIIGAYTP